MGLLASVACIWLLLYTAVKVHGNVSRLRKEEVNSGDQAGITLPMLPLEESAVGMNTILEARIALLEKLLIKQAHVHRKSLSDISSRLLALEQSAVGVKPSDNLEGVHTTALTNVAPRLLALETTAVAVNSSLESSSALLQKLSANIEEVQTNVQEVVLPRIQALEQALDKLNAFSKSEISPPESRSNCSGTPTQADSIRAALNEENYSLAERIFAKLENSTVIADTVCNLCSFTDLDFHRLIDLTRVMENPSLRMQILESLHTQAVQREQLSAIDLVALAKILSQEGEISHDELFDVITAKSTAYLVDALVTHNYQADKDRQNLTAEIAEWPNVSEKMMTGLVTQVFKSVDSKAVLDAVSNHSDNWQALVGVNALIEKLNESDTFKGTIVLNIAHRLNEIVRRDNFSDRAIRVKMKLPQCFRNLFFLKSFCLENTLFKDYASSGSAYEGYMDAFITWKIKWNGESLSVSNLAGHNLYRNTTWIPEPFEEHCLFRAVDTNYYLRMKIDLRNGIPFQRRTLEGKQPYAELKDNGNIWKIVSC